MKLSMVSDFFNFATKITIIVVYHQRWFSAIETKLVLGYPAEDIGKHYFNCGILSGAEGD